MAISNGAALVGGLALAIVAGWQFTVASDAQREAAGLRQQLASRQSSELAAAKRSCADRSAAYFAKLGYDESGVKDDASSTFQDHYSPTLKRCIMSIETDSYKPPRPTIMKMMFDTDERIQIGQMFWITSDTKKYWEQPPVQCTMNPPGQDEQTCHTTDEYDAFTKKMMAS